MGWFFHRLGCSCPLSDHFPLAETWYGPLEGQAMCSYGPSLPGNGTEVDGPWPKSQIMNTKLISAAVVGSFLALTACSDAPKNADKMEQKVDNAMEDLRAGKDEVGRELRDLREKLAVELTKAEEKLKDPSLKPEERAEWEAFKADVNTQIARLDGNLNDVESATSNVWEDVKAGTRRTADDIGDWFERQADKIDRKTEADKDNDGH